MDELTVLSSHLVVNPANLGSNTNNELWSRLRLFANAKENVSPPFQEASLSPQAQQPLSTDIKWSNVNT